MDQESTLVKKQIGDMFADCSYCPSPGPGHVPMSECCRRHATSGVVRGDGVTEFRCSEHEGLLSGGGFGTVVEFIMEKRDTPS